MRNFLTRLKKLEALSNKGKFPGVLIVYRQQDGSLQNAEGEPVNDTDFFGLLVILYADYEGYTAAQQTAAVPREQPAQPVPVKPSPTAAELAADTERRIDRDFQRMIDTKKQQRQDRQRLQWK